PPRPTASPTACSGRSPGWLSKARGSPASPPSATTTCYPSGCPISSTSRFRPWPHPCHPPPPPRSLPRGSRPPPPTGPPAPPRARGARPADGQRPLPARDGAKETAERAASRAASPPRLGRRGNREKELFALRAQHVKTLFRSLEVLTAAINKEAGTALLV